MSDPTDHPSGIVSERDTADSLLRAVAHVPALAVGDAVSQRERALRTASLPADGQVLDGRFRLGEMLGAGGMGAVYAATNLRTGKEVAIKVLLPNRARHVERFVREARAAARIRHPNVVDVYDVEPGGETPYLVMERLHGSSLRVWMQTPRAVHEVVTTLLGALEGVCEAHRQGVIHRDLKPENIFIARAADGAAEVAKVLDFGVSRLLARDLHESEATPLTETGNVLGTPAYMPLEQLRGRVDEVDARADVYALGVILYEALSGARPHRAANNHDLVALMVTSPPTPLRSVAPTVDAQLEAVVMRALAVDASKRHATVRELTDALVAWRQGARESPPRPFGRWAAVTVLACAAAAAAVWHYTQATAPTRPRAVASHERTLPRSADTSTRAPETGAPAEDVSTRILAPAPPTEARAPDEASPQKGRPVARRGRAAPLATPSPSDPQTALRVDEF